MDLKTDDKTQLEYWIHTAGQDLDAARILADHAKYRHALIFTHLALEKMLKSYMLSTLGLTPPALHNLVELADIAQISLRTDQLDFLSEVNSFSVDQTSPASPTVPLTESQALLYLSQADEMIKWLLWLMKSK